MFQSKAKHFSHPTKQHWKASTRVIGYTDLDYAHDDEKKSVTGGVITLGGSPTYFTPKMQATVNLTSTKAEYCHRQV